MKISSHILYETRRDALGDIKLFKKTHPKSEKEFQIRREINYQIEEI